MRFCRSQPVDFPPQFDDVLRPADGRQGAQVGQTELLDRRFELFDRTVDHPGKHGGQQQRQRNQCQRQEDQPPAGGLHGSFQRLQFALHRGVRLDEQRARDIMQAVESRAERLELFAGQEFARPHLTIQRLAACLQRGQCGARTGVGEQRVELRQLGVQFVEALPQGRAQFGILQQMVLPRGALQLTDRFDDLAHVARDREAAAGELALGVDHALQHVHRIDQAAGERHDQHAHGDDDQDGE